MKYCSICIILAFTCFSLPSCQKKVKKNTASNILSPADKEAVQGLIQGAFDDLWGGLDSTKILDYHTEDFVILEQGEVWDNAKIRSWMKQNLAQNNKTKRINRMDYLSMDKYGESISTSYKNYASFVQGDSIVGRAQWLESAIAIQTPSGWKLKMMHSTWMKVKEE